MSDKSVFDVTKYNIKDDCKDAILKACKDANDYAKKNKKTAEVFFPKGKYTLSQITIEKLDNVNIHLAKDAVIRLYKKKDYKWDVEDTCVNIKNCKNIKIYGESKNKSIFDGEGSSWWGKDGKRPDFINIQECNNYEVYKLAFNNSPNHTIKLSSCKKGKIHDITITSPIDSPNTDGIDPMGDVDDLEIYKCTITNGDDGFAINSNRKSGKINNIRIHDCTLIGGHGISMGSAIKYDITNVTFENITLDGAWYAVRIKFGGSPNKNKVENIKYNNITAKNITREVIRITSSYDKENPNSTSTLKDISINNLVSTSSEKTMRLDMVKKSQVLNPIVLNNVSITGAKDTKVNITNVPLTFKGKIVGIPKN